MDLSKCQSCPQHKNCRSEFLVITTLQEFEGLVSNFSFSCLKLDNGYANKVIVSPCQNCTKKLESCHIRRALITLMIRRNGTIGEFSFKCKFFVEENKEPVRIFYFRNPQGEDIKFKIPVKKLTDGQVCQWPDLPQ